VNCREREEKGRWRLRFWMLLVESMMVKTKARRCERRDECSGNLRRDASRKHDGTEGEGLHIWKFVCVWVTSKKSDCKVQVRVMSTQRVSKDLIYRRPKEKGIREHPHELLYIDRRRHGSQQLLHMAAAHLIQWTPFLPHRQSKLSTMSCAASAFN
jgi:hypothetical protein